MTRFAGLVIYVFFSLIIGEFHPFSRAEMYDHFPDSSELIAVTDSAGNAIKFKEDFSYSIGDLTHNHSTIKINLPASLTIEQSDSLLGLLLWKQLKSYQIKSLPNDQLQIRRIIYTSNQGKIVSSSKVLYDANN